MGDFDIFKASILGQFDNCVIKKTNPQIEKFCKQNRNASVFKAV